MNADNVQNENERERNPICRFRFREGEKQKADSNTEYVFCFTKQTIGSCNGMVREGREGNGQHKYGIEDGLQSTNHS